ncbi:MAG: hypothetical protein K940chlam2_01457 [Chlamydiae bacterium]|nr:hypothetical protein [Chlamydiota bacterium]
MQKKRTYQRKKAVPRKSTKRRTKPQAKGFRGWWKRMTSL